MTDRDVVERARMIAGAGNIRFAPQQGPRRKPIWCWQVNHEAVDLMGLLKPLMGERRQNRISEVVAAYEQRDVIRRFWMSGEWRREQARLALDNQKRCVRCRQVKPITDFYLDNRTEKRRGHCVDCHLAIRR